MESKRATLKAVKFMLLVSRSGKPDSTARQIRRTSN
jgi:hypothetical protein